MPAQVAANLPFDPTPPPARSQVPASGFQFLNLLTPPRSAGANHPSTSPSDSSSAAATARVATTDSAPRSNGGQNANGGQSSSGDQHNTGAQRDPSNADGAARVMMVPVPIPLQPIPQPAGSAASAAATAPLAGTLGAPQLTPSSPADAAALLLLAANTLATDPTLPAAAAATGAAGTGTSAPTITATASQTALPGQVLPSMAGNLALRIAAGALTLVSQPRVTLATATPEITASPKPSASGTDLAALGRPSLSAEAAHGSSTPGTAAAAGSIDELLAAAAKDAAGTASPLARSPTEQSATPPSPTGNTSSATVPQLATMTPPPVIANEIPVAMAIPPHVVAEQVAVSLRQAVNSGSDHIQIQLQPADLGAVEVKLSINHDGRVTVVVSADRSDTLNLLQQDASSLAQALRDAGLQADSSSLSFNLRGGYQFNQQQNALAGAPQVDDLSTGGIDGIDAAPTAARRAHAGSLDIHV